MNLRRTLFVLPNLMTLGSIFCGFSAIQIVAGPEASVDEFNRAAVLLIFAMLFDLLDGRVARMTRTQSAFGLQIDSLADVISFGVAPALLVYQWVLHRLPLVGLFVAFLFVACGAIRLARFNVLATSSSGHPTKPGKYIVGLPIPPAAGILISLVVANHASGNILSAEHYTPVFFVVMLGLSLLMVSNIRFRSFKDLKLNTGSILLVLFVLGSSAFVWNRSKPQFVLVWLLAMYIGIGLLESVREIARRMFVRARGSVPPAAGAS